MTKFSEKSQLKNFSWVNKPLERVDFISVDHQACLLFSGLLITRMTLNVVLRSCLVKENSRYVKNRCFFDQFRRLSI